MIIIITITIIFSTVIPVIGVVVIPVVPPSSTVLAAGVGEAQLVIDWATPADTGLYLCHAANEVATIAAAARTALVVPREYSHIATNQSHFNKDS